MAKKSRASSLIFTILALFAVATCIKLGFWQYDRYQLRHSLTSQIISALDRRALELTSTNQSNVKPWLKVRISGKYSVHNQMLSRGHYFNNQYGLEVLSLFIPSDSLIPPIWVDRGWIPTTKGADQLPAKPAPPNGIVTIEGILREYDDPAEARGVLFALPAPRIGRIDEVTLQKVFPGETLHYYLKINTNVATTSTIDDGHALDVAPLAPPGQGPHLAYAIQWWIFALLIIGTRIALLKTERD